MIMMNNPLKCILLLFSLIFVSCTTEIHETNILPYSPELSVDSLKYNDISDDSKRTILYVDKNRMESNDTVVNNQLRSFNTKELLQLRIYDDRTVRLTSWVCEAIHDVSIYCSLQNIGMDEPFLIAHIDSLPALGQIDYTPRFVNNQSIYQTADGKYIDFELPYLKSDDVKFTVSSNDSLYNKLQNEIKVSWNLSFSNYHLNSSWGTMDAIYAREWVVMITNLAYMVSSPEMNHIVHNYNAVMGGELYGNDGETFNADDYEDLYNRLTMDRTLILGRTTMGGGLGGGTTLGVDHWMFYTHYYSLSSQAWDMISHEFAHCMGYNHSSNLTYGNSAGFAVNCMPWLHNYLRKQERLPYRNPKKFDFTNPDYEKYWGHSVDYSAMKYTDTDTKMDIYFRDNADKVSSLQYKK